MAQTPTVETPAAPRIEQHDHSGIAGHPRGLTTLFFTELWERFSYYGMRALLILFMTDTQRGGLGFSVARAARIYGLYTAAVYMVALPGGWVADRILGQRRAVLIGGIIIALGHFSLAIVGLPFFYTGLLLIVAGTGLLKPNISTMVGALYGRDDPRRDGGFSIFYMGINLGAFFSPLVCGTLGEKIGWHWGFAAAGVGMVFGLLQYVLGGHRLGTAGLYPSKPEPRADGQGRSLLGGSLWLGGLAFVFVAFVVPDLSALGRLFVLGLGSTLFVVALFQEGKFTAAEKSRGVVIYIFFWVAALFWSAFEQAGSSLNLFAERMTDRTLPLTVSQMLPGDYGQEFPASWFQSLNPLYIILLAPVFAWLWVKLGKHEPSSPAKFSYGLLFVGLGFAVMIGAAMLVRGGDTRVSPLWLVATYLLHTIGELCLSPVGLSLMTKLAPPRIVGQIMGVWFLSAAVGNYMGGQIASLFEAMPLAELFGWVCLVNVAAGLVLAAFSKPIRRLMSGVH